MTRVMWRCVEKRVVWRQVRCVSREANVSRLRRERLDVLVVGGGATGGGIALDAALRGLKVGLIERGDFGSQTSSRSTKLIWAGIKYVATAVAELLRPGNLFRPLSALAEARAEMRLVSAAHRERVFMLETQAHLTSWLPICVPVTKWVMVPPPLGHPLFSLAPLALPLVFKFYDYLGGFRCPGSYVMSRRQVAEKFPQLDQSSLKYAAVFYEGSHNDARTALAIALTAAENGALVANHVEMKGFAAAEEGVACRDLLAGDEFVVAADRVVFAGGPFTDRLRGPSAEPAVTGAAGSHVVLRAGLTPPDMGLLDMSTSDGRFLFVVPWQGHTIIGTTDVPGEPTSTAAAPEDEIRWLLREGAKYLSADPTRDEVRSAWRGWRPLAHDPHNQNGGGSFQSRDHVVAEDPDTGAIFVAGGKWTTYREMAQDVVDRLSSTPCTTLTKKLVGGDGFPGHRELADQLSVDDPDVAAHLAATYGTRASEVLDSGSHARLHPDFPYIEAEVRYACDSELARTVYDVLSLRTRLAFLDSDAAILVAPRVADLVADALGWSDHQKAVNLRATLDALREFAGPDRPAR
ncbi:hypothetical protein CTAYLR_002408 [Chrysophaeum taylorii]|uniref:glycerol-3-phosphate dehydrogenase n=1 Tax=Chrysophaeum taylorii TaxID=2483200 RepID=A0AAD7UGE0_9STRA|nr:hypothetical protein CTAYLR_002408 [Chrysophaeum taylorii]